jgi:uncharacterized cupredoxin-like copper-binding protein
MHGRQLMVPGTALALATLMLACGGKDGTASGSTARGGPGDPATATRVVEIRAGDDLRFNPDTVQAKVGETITFRIVNTAPFEHNFTLGDEAAQAEHEREMRSMPSGDAMQMGDEPNSIHIQPGVSKDLTWTFTSPGTALYGCHVAGHYDAGMKGKVIVSK